MRMRGRVSVAVYNQFEENNGSPVMCECIYEKKKRISNRMVPKGFPLQCVRNMIKIFTF